VWNEVTTSTKEKNYVLCGFTYDLSFNDYDGYKATTEKEATAVHDFLLFALNSEVEGGQKLIETNDYLGLPTSVSGKAKTGAEEITF
jgi:hypothetical protein